MEKLNTTPKPFVKWVGGKRSVLHELHEHLPDTWNRYYEPFIGGGALFFDLTKGQKISEATLLDNNLELVITYQVIKKEPHKLTELLRVHKDNHSEEYYYDIRAKEGQTPLETAARFLYLNKTCFNGLYRVNKSGKFNSPIGNYKNPNIVQEENILAVHEALKDTDIEYGDFQDIDPQKGDFVYFDPPYHPVGEQSFTSYTKDDFNESDQIRLRDFVMSLHKKGVKCMISNSKTTFIDEIYKSKIFNKHIIQAPRYVNCKSDGRGGVEEFLITNY